METRDIAMQIANDLRYVGPQVLAQAYAPRMLLLCAKALTSASATARLAGEPDVATDAHAKRPIVPVFIWVIRNLSQRISEKLTSKKNGSQ